MKKVWLREYKESDLAAVFTLDQVCFAAPFRFSQRAMRQFAESRNAMTVVGEDHGTGQIAGFCIAHVERTGKECVAYVVTLDVAPEQRRRELARVMMNAIEQKAQGAGCRSIELHVSVENSGAIAFYERVGYERVRPVRAFYGPGRDAYLYRKELGATQNLNR